MELFEHAARRELRGVPLAERVRPETLDEILGQERLLGPNTPLRRAIEADRMPSVVLWGPPGCGKTTLARALARSSGAYFVAFSAVLGGVKEIRAIVAEARERRTLHGRRTLLFVDEIHRFNRSQQDAFLPHIEDGTITLVGATTENPSFELNAALLSRLRVLDLDPLGPEALQDILRRTLRHPALGFAGELPELDEEALQALAGAAGGDARQAINSLEAALALAQEEGLARLGAEDVGRALQRRLLRHDRDRDAHFALASAFIKSLRGSDPDAAIYYMVRMLEGGESPRFVCRRLVISAAEDVGLADPRALQVAIAAQQAFELVGLPEGVLPLTEAAAYIACAPKSNSVLRAYAAARKDVLQHGTLAVPIKLRNAVNSLARAQGHGASYRYPHDLEGGYSPEHYLPEELQGRCYLAPGEAGEEIELGERLREWRARRQDGSAPPPAPGPPSSGVPRHHGGGSQAPAR